MKMTQSDFEALESAVYEWQTRQNVNLVDAALQYELGKFPRSEAVKDLQRRFSFDVLYAAVRGTDLMQRFYEYLDDDHIFTAIKKIVPAVERKF